MMDKLGYRANKVDTPDRRDEGNADKWVPRDPRLNRLTGIHPFNCEAPLSVLREHGFLTPATLHYVRNHGLCPKLFWHSHSIDISGFLLLGRRVVLLEHVERLLNASNSLLQVLLRDDIGGM